jgi:hypothetical protein
VDPEHLHAIDFATHKNGERLLALDSNSQEKNIFWSSRIPHGIPYFCDNRCRALRSRPSSPPTLPFSRRRPTPAWVGAVAVASLFVVASADAFAASKRIGIPKFEGGQEALVRKAVMQALKVHGYELVKSREMDAAAAGTGAHLDSDDGLASLAKELALSAIITGEVGARRAKIVVHDGSDGSVLGDASFAGANPRKLATEVGREFWVKLGADVGRGRVPAGAKKNQKAAADDTADEGDGAPAPAGDDAPVAEARPKPRPDPSAEPSDDAAAEAPPPRRKKPRPKMETPPEEADEQGTPSTLPWIDLGVGIGGLNRSLTFYQNVVGGVLPYSLGFGPIADVNLLFYPIVPLLDGWVAGFGLDVEIQQGFSISSNVPGGGSYSNTVHDYLVGARYRIPFAGADEIFFAAGGGEDAFTFNGANRGALNIPDTIYRYARLGLGMRLALPSDLSIAFGAGYRIVANDAGSQISTHFFPHLAVAGADADVVIGYALSQYFEVRAGLTWRRYWFAMNSIATDTFIAGGAVDQSFAFTGGIAFTFGDGAAKAELGADDAPPPPPKPKAKARRRAPDDETEEGAGADGDSGGGKGDDKTGGDADE